MTESEEKADEVEAADAGEVEVVERPEVIQPWGWVSDWFEEWPRLFGGRLPEPSWRIPSEVETIRVEQFRDGDEVVIRAELPGVDPDEAIDVSVTGDRLTVSARRERREESKSDEGFRSEFHYGSFRRVMALPPGTSADDVTATYDDGILEVRVPADEAEATKTKVAVERKAR